MASSPDQAALLARAVVEVYAEAELRLLEIVAVRLRRGIDSPGWAEQKLLQIQQVRREIDSVLGHLTPAGRAAIEEALRKAYNRGLAQAGADLARGGIEANFIGSNEAAITAMLVEAVARVQVTHLRILRQPLDAYRQVVAEASRMGVLGVDTRREVAQRALDRLLGRGITGFTDAAGRNWDLSSYVEMATRSTLGRALIDGYSYRLQQDGEDLVIISADGHSCPLCMPWEGMVLSLSGQTEGYQTLDEAINSGLFHANCGHRQEWYGPGYTPPLAKSDPQVYEDRQELRYLERGVRAWKRRAVLALDDQTKAQANAKVREWQGRIRSYTQQTGLIRQRQREQLGAR